MADDRLPDEALVVRGGCPPYDRDHGKSLLDGLRTHNSGLYGFSVQAGDETLGHLANYLPNKVVGVTNVGEIRQIGYDVVQSSGAGRHATVVVPREWNQEDADRLGRLFREKKNPNSLQRRPR